MDKEAGPEGRDGNCRGGRGGALDPQAAPDRGGKRGRIKRVRTDEGNGNGKPVDPARQLGYKEQEDERRNLSKESKEARPEGRGGDWEGRARRRSRPKARPQAGADKRGKWRGSGADSGSGMGRIGRTRSR